MARKLRIMRAVLAVTAFAALLVELGAGHKF
jgi:hypothetical protein